MKVKNAFFNIGSIGMIWTAVMHIIMTMFILKDASHSTWLGVYPVFIVFLALGTYQIYKEEGKGLKNYTN
ncbi:MAG TPA: hypothetical protein VK921_01735 [Anditalea sp.]|nr:hypothetical protein [Anditalea sp.]